MIIFWEQSLLKQEKRLQYEAKANFHQEDTEEVSAESEVDTDIVNGLVCGDTGTKEKRRGSRIGKETSKIQIKAEEPDIRKGEIRNATKMSQASFVDKTGISIKFKRNAITLEEKSKNGEIMEQDSVR